MKKISLFFVFMMMSAVAFTTAAYNDVRGDADGDGEVSIADVTTLIDYLLSGVWPEVQHDYVDMGLPSGTLWATCNVGAHTPEEFGDYFAWGETEPRDYYAWVTYKWCWGTGDAFTKYQFSAAVLELEDDAAYVNWGPSWCMPTSDQLEELRNSCTWRWMEYNGVIGAWVTGPNGKYIFLPAAGDRSGTSLNDVGSRGYYWSRELSYGVSTAIGFWFMSQARNTYDYDRCMGYTVRPVRVPQN